MVPNRRFSDDPWAGIEGLSYRNLDGKVTHNPARTLRKDVGSIPWPAYHLFKIERYTNLQPITDGLDLHARSYTLVTSRGCPYQCVYCSKPITGHTWRAREPEDVVAEWRYLVEEMGATEIGITDDVWNLKLERAKEICRLLIAEGLTGVPWVTVHGMRADHTDAELFQLDETSRLQAGRVWRGEWQPGGAGRDQEAADAGRCSPGLQGGPGGRPTNHGLFHLWPAG